jgi:hypothetical protein
MKAFRWIVSSLEDEKGQASYKRIGIAIFLFLVAYMVLARMITTTLWLNAFYALLTAASVWVGLVTVSQILMFFGRDKSQKEEVPDDGLKHIEGDVTLKS